MLVSKLNYLDGQDLCSLVDTLLKVQDLNRGRLELDPRTWTTPLSDGLLASMHELSVPILVVTAYRASALLKLPMGTYFYWALAERTRDWIKSEEEIEAKVLVAIMHHFAHQSLKPHALKMARHVTDRLKHALKDNV